jgi:ABC-type transport system involved in cytochrome c biogenesis permease component
MNGAFQHLTVSLRLHFRNRMALLYGYLFPLIFLVAFWVLYRHEKIPLLRHMGELLTVSVLGGACFGLPTTLVSERERGVWRRYRLTPVATWVIVTSTVLVRFLLVVSAGLLQLGAAFALGMTAPAHPFALAIAFSAVALAFIGLGLVLATLADNVPAVQALGQCIFLPMLIIGGVAVPLASLPDWALHVSAFFPGRYAAEALQTAVTGAGLAGMRFSLLALVLIGAAGCLAGAKLFRWDAQQRFFQRQGKGWLAVALGAWLAVGALAEWRGRIALPADAEARPAAPAVGPAPVPAPVPPAFTPPSAPVTPPAPLTGWQTMTSKDLDALDFRVPPDGGVVSPFAPPDDEPIDFVADLVNGVRSKLPTWAPGAVKDEVQAVRNILFVAAVPDAVQLPVERYLPGVVLEHLVQRYPKEKLVKLLTWIAQHPEEGSVIDDISDLGIDGAAGDPLLVQERAYLYALKFLIRLTDRKPPN